jgi:[ribosomal protein S18]-alanine N-acetyltransferase
MNVINEPPTIATHIRWIVTKDLPEVLAIEQASFDDPWSEEMFKTFLRQQFAIGMVAEIAGSVHGFMLYELHKEHYHLVSLAVQTKCRRLGIGKQMVDKLKAKLSTHRRPKLSLQVQERNLPAQLFFRSQGFLATHIEHKPYDSIDDDAYAMEFTL